MENDRSERMQAAIKELEETAIVMTHLQARHSAMIRDHAEWLASHEMAMTESRERAKKTDAQIAELGDRITALVSGMGEFISRQSSKQ